MSVPTRIHDDFQALIDSLLSFAKSMVSESGSFNPFGAVMYPDGAIQWIAVDTGDDFPASQVLIDSMTEMLIGMTASGEIRAATICYVALIVPPGETGKVDVISYALERSSGESMNAYLPYSRKETGDVECGELFIGERSPQFFPEVAS